MAITTTLQTKFAAQKILVIVLSLGLGLWGVWDYTVKIPRERMSFERGQVCFAVRQAMAVDAKSEHIDEARDLVQLEFKKLKEIGVVPDLNAKVNIDPAVAITSVKTGDPVEWQKTLVVFFAGVQEAKRRTPDTDPSAMFVEAANMARDGVDLTANVSKPSKFDLFTQWMFILCLPFVPFFLWSFIQAKKRVYTLDDDGTLHAPEGAWTKSEIDDIDMSKWMSKSIASVVHTGGDRIKLDDYVYKNAHLIVGAIASEKYPDEWEPDGRLIKKDEAPGEGDEPVADSAEAAAAPAEDPARTGAEA